MYKLKLIKGLSYSGGDIKATKASPFCEVKSEELANKAIQSGYFSLIEIVETEITKVETIEYLTIAQLEALAGKQGIDVSGCKKKAEYLSVISAYTGGSQTMIELQKEGD